jgi:hypothetical protein
VRNHIPKRVPECLMLRNHNIIAIIFSLIDSKKRLSRRDTYERFHLSITLRQGEKFHQSSMRWVGTARYDHINLFGTSKHVSTLVLLLISCIASGLALIEDEQKFKLRGCVGAHKCGFHAPTYRVNVQNNHALASITSKLT